MKSKNQSIQLNPTQILKINMVQEAMKKKGLEVSKSKIIQKFFNVGESQLSDFIKNQDIDGFWSYSHDKN